MPVRHAATALWGLTGTAQLGTLPRLVCVFVAGLAVWREGHRGVPGQNQGAPQLADHEALRRRC